MITSDERREPTWMGKSFSIPRRARFWRRLGAIGSFAISRPSSPLESVELFPDDGDSDDDDRVDDDDDNDDDDDDDGDGDSNDDDRIEDDDDDRTDLWTNTPSSSSSPSQETESMAWDPWRFKILLEQRPLICDNRVA